MIAQRASDLLKSLTRPPLAKAVRVKHVLAVRNDSHKSVALKLFEAYDAVLLVIENA